MSVIAFFLFAVWPHGGPHSLISAMYLNEVAFFVKQGFAVLFINFRGSLGHGQAGVLSLLGNVGDLDVKDCYQVMSIAVLFLWIPCLVIARLFKKDLRTIKS